MDGVGVGVMLVGIWVDDAGSQLLGCGLGLGLGGGSKSINHTSMHRVKHEEINESSAHGVPLPSRDCLSQP